ncbi:MAG: mRNA surveillance protein pelota [Candidatus ainarchaeum sp.]|nr:mRNA surveillance protein pelota [Candidatus ainarchaeum sp.]
MRVIKHDRETGTVKAVPETVEDLWHVERVLEPGDLVAGKSFRRVKIGEGESGDKREVFVQVEAEKIEFSEHANRVRVTGKIVAGGPEEYIQLGQYHTIDVEPQTAVEIKKKGGWRGYQLDRLYDAQKAGKKKILLAIVVMDDKAALFSTVRDYGVSFDFTVESHASKREADYSQKQLQFYGDVAKCLADSKAGKIIVAGPGFSKDNLRKFVQDRNPGLSKKLVFETASNAEPSGVYELLKRGVIEKVAGEERIAKEMGLMEGLMLEISKGSGLAAYGESEVRGAIGLGAAGRLFVTDELLRKNRQLDQLMQEAEKLKCEVHVFSSENPAGKQLAGLGGIAAMLRYRTG